MRICQQDRYTVRSIDGGPSEIRDDAWDAVCKATAFAMEYLNLPGHLFVTVIGADSLRTGEAEHECGFAMYHSGIQHIAVCGGDGPQEVQDDRPQWIHEVIVSTVHEIVHYWQELNGTLDGTDKNELEAEAMSQAISAYLFL